MQIGHLHLRKYTLNCNKLQEVDDGITVTNNLKPLDQCVKAAAKAMQVLGVIKKNFILAGKEDFQLLFNGVVCPHFEYCTCLVTLLEKGY